MLYFPKSISKHKKFTGKPSTKLPFPKLPLRASQEMVSCDRRLRLPSSQTMVIAYQSLISSFLSGRVAVGGTQLWWLILLKTAFEKRCLWEWDWMMSDWENFLYKSGLISSAREIELLVFLAGMLQFPLCVWAQWVCKCYFHQVLAVIFSKQTSIATS